MQTNKRDNRPYYHLIYRDIIKCKYPDKANICQNYLQKENWTAIDVMTVNKLLFGTNSKDTNLVNQKHKAYDYESVKQILNEQKINRLTNTEVAHKYKLSRNTIAKWKKCFPDFV